MLEGSIMSYKLIKGNYFYFYIYCTSFLVGLIGSLLYVRNTLILMENINQDGI